MRTIVFCGNAALASVQCWRTKRHAAAPWRRLAIAVRKQERRVLRLHLVGEAQLARAQQQRLVVELGERVQVAQLLLRSGGRAVAVEDPLEVVGVTGRRDHRRGRGGELGVDAGHRGGWRRSSSRHAAMVASSSPSTASAAASDAAQLAAQVVLAFGRLAEIGDDRAQQRGDALPGTRG